MIEKFKQKTPDNKGLCRAQHDTTAACRPWKFEQVYFQVNVDALMSLTH